jgi:hypothetical protein
MDARQLLSVYDDSEDVAFGLDCMRDGATGALAYWLPEAAIHIRGLYALACEMRDEIERLQLVQK